MPGKADNSSITRHSRPQPSQSATDYKTPAKLSRQRTTIRPRGNGERESIVHVRPEHPGHAEWPPNRPAQNVRSVGYGLPYLSASVRKIGFSPRRSRLTSRRRPCAQPTIPAPHPSFPRQSATDYQTAGIHSGNDGTNRPACPVLSASDRKIAISCPNRLSRPRTTKLPRERESILKR